MLLIGLAVDLQDHVAGLDAGLVGGRARRRLLDGDAALAVVADLVANAAA